MDSEYLIEIETLQASNLKQLFGALKEQLPEVCISITDEYIEILQMDPTHIVVAHVRLGQSNFEKYVCKKSIKLGVDVVNLTKVLKGVGAKDILTLFVKDPSNSINSNDDNEASQLFGIRIENTEKGQVTTIYIDTLEVNEEELSVPDLDYPYFISLPAGDLQSIVNSHKTMGGEIILQIRYVKESLIFFSKGDIGKLETIRSKTSKEESSIKIIKNYEDTDIIEIYVKLSKMVEFAKCSSLSSMTTMYLKNDFPLFLEYDVGSLGFIRLGVSPHKKPDSY